MLLIQPSGITRSHIHTVVAAESQSNRKKGRDEQSHKTLQRNRKSTQSHNVASQRMCKQACTTSTAGDAIEAAPNYAQIVAREYHTSITRRRHEQGRRDMRVENHRVTQNVPAQHSLVPRSCQSIARVSHFGGTSRLASLRRDLRHTIALRSHRAHENHRITRNTPAQQSLMPRSCQSITRVSHAGAQAG